MHRSSESSIVSTKSAAAKQAAETRRRRRDEREARAWLGRLGVLMDEPPHDRTFWFRAFAISDVDVETALEQAIAEVLRAMAPLTPEEIASERDMGVEDPHPLEYDVAITHGGKILAVIQASADEPIVTRFRGAKPGLQQC